MAENWNDFLTRTNSETLPSWFPVSAKDDWLDNLTSGVKTVVPKKVAPGRIKPVFPLGQDQPTNGGDENQKKLGGLIDDMRNAVKNPKKAADVPGLNREAPNPMPAGAASVSTHRDPRNTIAYADLPSTREADWQKYSPKPQTTDQALATHFGAAWNAQPNGAAYGSFADKVAARKNLLTQDIFNTTGGQRPAAWDQGRIPVSQTSGGMAPGTYASDNPMWQNAAVLPSADAAPAISEVDLNAWLKNRTDQSN